MGNKAFPPCRSRLRGVSHSKRWSLPTLLPLFCFTTAGERSTRSGYCCTSCSLFLLMLLAFTPTLSCSTTEQHMVWLCSGWGCSWGRMEQNYAQECAFQLWQVKDSWCHSPHQCSLLHGRSCPANDFTASGLVWRQHGVESLSRLALGWVFV